MATQTERRHATVAAIEMAAKALFEAHGFSATTIDAIVGKAGVAKGAFYHHFASKEAIFERVLDSTLKSLAREVMASARPEDSPTDRLVRGLRVYMQTCGRPGTRQVVLVDGPATLGWAKWRRLDEKHFGSMTQHTVMAALGPHARPAEVLALTTLISGAFAEAALASAAGTDPRLSSRHLADAMTLLLTGLRTPTGQQPKRGGSAKVARTK